MQGRGEAVRLNERKIELNEDDDEIGLANVGYICFRSAKVELPK